MSNVLAVLRREYLQRVRSKWFILTTLGLPLFMMAVIAIPVWLEIREERGDRTVAVADETGVLYQRVAERAGDAFEMERVEGDEADPAALDRRVATGEISGYLVLDAGTVARGEAVYRGAERPRTISRMRLEQAVREAVLGLHMEESGGDVQALLSGSGLEFETLGGEEEGEREVAMVAGFVGAFVLYMVILIYGVQVMRSVMEEKTSRIVEVIVSALRPWQLMLGKILGVGAVGLTQMAVWMLMGLLVSSFGIPALVASRPALSDLEGLTEHLPAVGGILLFVAYFVLGYFLYASLYAAVAAMCSSDEEAQQTQMPVTVLIIAPIFILQYVMEDPDSTLSVATSLFPFFSPILMYPRYVAGAPLWQALLSLVLMAVTIVAVAWVAGRIYRVGILMQGKRPTLPEIWRWVREA